MGPGRSSSLRIGGGPSAVSGSGRTRGTSDRSAAVELRNVPGALALPLDKGKGRINLIEYPEGSEYLKSAVQHALTVGPSKVGPSYGATFAKRYRPPFGVRVWSPDVLTFYVVSVPKMVCFFEVAFDNNLRFPLHPFIKGVLQHFNVCPSQLATNGCVTPPTRHPMGVSSEGVTLRDWDSLTFSFLELTPAFICTISVITKILFTFILYIPP